MLMYVLNKLTAINADQNLPILQFSKEDITRGEESQTFTNVTPHIPRNTDKGTASVQSFDGSKTPPSTARKHDEEESNDDKDNEVDDKDHEEHEDPEDTAEVETSTDMTNIIDVVQKLCRESNERKTITFLDFAGQSIYYAFHQIFLSRTTFSILVVDMTKKPEDLATNVSDDDVCCSRFESWTYKGKRR